MTRLATSLTLRDRVLDIEEYLTAIRAVEVDDVRRVLADITGAGRALSMVGPADALRSVDVDHN
jgi:predicted Zn-dependent peptidase